MPSVDQSVAQAAQGEVERAVERALASYAMPAAEYLNTEQAAKYVGYSKQYLEIARHRADGSGPDYYKQARAVRYKRADLDRWMESGRKSNAPIPVKTARRRANW